VIEISEKILDLEPHGRATVLADATISSHWFIDAGQAGVPDCRRNFDGQTSRFGVGRYNFRSSS
jgi:hypothetical protein